LRPASWRISSEAIRANAVPGRVTVRHLFQIVQGATAVLAFGLLPFGARPPAAGRIERVASLGTPRAAHTATALPSGRLLVAGGMGAGGGGLASAELVDLSGARASRVEAVAPMAHARAGHTAVALPDGRVVVAGGYDGGYLGSVEVFDPARRRFQPLGELSEGRSGHTATLLRDGRILIAGGVGRGWSFLSSAEMLDPRSGRSEPVRPMSIARESHTATLLPDGRVLIIGGHRGRRAAMEVHASAEIYDPATRRFHPAGQLTTARHKHDAVLLANGSVLVLGGADRTDRRHFATTEVYDPATGVFKPGPSMASTRYKLQGTAIRLPNGDVLVPSGSRRAELLDRRSFTFRPVPGELPAAYAFSTATRLSTGDVAIVGGYDSGNQNTAGVWLFRAR
jgi:hypothetical protein